MCVGALSFGELLKEHRLAAGLSQEELADRAHLSVKTVSALEQGVRQKPYRETVDALADALDLSSAMRLELERAAAQRTGPVRAALVRAAADGRKRGALLNMPGVVTSLVDRHDEVREILDALSRYRLVTITGAGGVGKTRVAVAVAERYAGPLIDEVAFVDLSPLSQGSLIAGMVSAALGAPAAGDFGGLGSLTHYLRNRKSLLVFDNCEHLVDDVAAFAHVILQACPGVAILATSRERLEVPGEALYRLPSLAFPQSEARSAEGAASYSAIRLFVERAKALDPRFGLTDQNVDLIADICRRLEGIPLAIELASAHIPALGLPALRARLDESFILASSARGVPSRHATMHATIAWSYDLLREIEQRLLNRLSVFVDGFTLEAAEAVCADETLQSAEIPGLVTSLVNKSLVNVTFDAEPARYRLLDSVRAYAAEQLARDEEPDLVARRHASWLLDLTHNVQRSSDGWSGDLSGVLSELGNIRAALQWGLDSQHEQDTIAAGRIAGGLRGLWLRTNRNQECRLWTESLIRRIDEERYPDVVAPLWAGLVQAIGEAPEIPQDIGHAVRIFERIGDYAGVIHLKSALAGFFDLRGCYVEAESILRDALRLGVEHHLEDSSAYVHALGRLALALSAQERGDEARESISQALQLLPLHERAWRRWLSVVLAEIEFESGNTAKALETAQEANHRFPNPGADRSYLYVSIVAYNLAVNHIDEAVEFAHEVASWRDPDDAGHCAIEELAAIGALRGDASAAAWLLGYLNAWRERSGFYPRARRRFTHDLLVRALQARLSQDAIDTLQREGRTLSYDQANDVALQLG
jgi:predicted ATPase/transcriptional regulator with XRE-family HTH domain